jgi:adenylate cyclase
VEIGFERQKFRRMSYGRLILTKSVVYFLILSLTFAGMTITDFVVITGGFDFGKWFEVFLGVRLTIPLLYMSVITVLIIFIRQISSKFGPGNLWKMITGKFHHPREEDRIFMCLDLKSSTTIAEKLGHIKYSQMIQDCFNDLPIVEKNDAEVYQYVGDEVVLSWPVVKGIQNSNCIKAYFNYVNYLQFRKEYYQELYGLQPEFKAGVNLGKVTVAEVGAIKKEIAFHGDTLNTTARIQGMCNQMQKRLLISESLKDKLEASGEYIVAPMGVMHLRGREKEIGIFSVEEIA